AAPDDLDLQCATRVVSAPRPCGLGRSRWQTSPGRWALRINGQQRKGSPSQRSPSSRRSPSGLAVSWRSPELAQNPSARPPTSRNSYSGCSIMAGEEPLLLTFAAGNSIAPSGVREPRGTIAGRGWEADTP